MKETANELTAGAFTQASLPATSLTICSRNRPILLLETVESVLQGDEVPTEIIIFDQSDTPHPTLETLEQDQTCKIRYLWTCSVGVGRARNAAISAAQHDILALTDDDMFVTPTWFGTLIRALLRAGPRSVVTGQVRSAEAEMPDAFAPSTKVEADPVVYEGRIGKDILFTGNMAMYRSAINDIGTFDERLGTGARFPAAYDNDFGFRLLEAGYRILYVPEAVVYHRAWRSERDYIRLRWCYGRGQGGFYAKHLSLRDPHMLQRLGSTIVNHTLRFPIRLWCQRRIAYGDAIYVLGLLSGVSEWLMTQRKTR